MIFLGKQAPSRRQKHLHQVRHPPYDPERAQRRLFLNVRVGRLDQAFHFRCQISRHLWRGDGAERTQCQADYELCVAVQITVGRKFKKLMCGLIEIERIRDGINQKFFLFVTQLMLPIIRRVFRYHINVFFSNCTLTIDAHILL